MTVSDDLTFPDLPPFPSDVPTAPLLRISLQKLLDNDPTEIDRFYQTCCDVGFFYLDVRNAIGSVDPSVQANGHTNGHTHGNTNGHANGATNGHTNGQTFTGAIDGNAFLSDADRLFGVAKEFYDLPVEEKIKYDFKDQGSYFGYKGYGAGLVDKEGNKDRNEFYNVSKDDIAHLSDPLPAPKCLTPHRPLMRSYIHTSHAIILLLLNHLTTALALPPTTLTALHNLHTHSGDQIRFVRSPPQPHEDRRAALGAHTDFGSVTLLFNRLGGLQILPPSSDGLDEEAKSEAWEYVKPLRGHCVVNLGDALVKFTRRVLRSNVHRVVNPPGMQGRPLEEGGMVRYSLVYFSRPSDEVMLRPLEGSKVIDARKVEGKEEEGEVVSSKEWVLRRALGRRGVGDWGKSEGTEGERRKVGEKVREREVAVEEGVMKN